MTTYVLGPEGSHAISPGISPGAVAPMRHRIRPGAGYLAGNDPGGLTTVENVPVSATVRVLLRTASGHPGDGVLVAQVQSASDGTWLVTGLDPALKYDVVGRYAGRNDVIAANVSPLT